MCPDGSYMIRNPWNKCFFHACPTPKVGNYTFICPLNSYKITCWISSRGACLINTDVGMEWWWVETQKTRVVFMLVGPWNTVHRMNFNVRTEQWSIGMPSKSAALMNALTSSPRTRSAARIVVWSHLHQATSQLLEPKKSAKLTFNISNTFFESFCF